MSAFLLLFQFVFKIDDTGGVSFVVPVLFKFSCNCMVAFLLLFQFVLKIDATGGVSFVVSVLFQFSRNWWRFFSCFSSF